RGARRLARALAEPRQGGDVRVDGSRRELRSVATWKSAGFRRLGTELDGRLGKAQTFSMTESQATALARRRHPHAAEPELAEKGPRPLCDPAPQFGRLQHYGLAAEREDLADQPLLAADGHLLDRGAVLEPFRARRPLEPPARHLRRQPDLDRLGVP